LLAKGTSIVRYVNVKRAKLCAAANPAGGSRLQSLRPVAEPRLLGRYVALDQNHSRLASCWLLVLRLEFPECIRSSRSASVMRQGKVASQVQSQSQRSRWDCRKMPRRIAAAESSSKVRFKSLAGDKSSPYRLGLCPG